MLVNIGNKVVHVPRSQNIGIDIFYINTSITVYAFATSSTVVL